MASFQCHDQYVTDKDVIAAEKECIDWSLAEDEEDSDHLGTEARETFRVEEAGGVKAEKATREAVPELRLVSAESALKLANRGGEKNGREHHSTVFRRQLLT